MRFGQPGLEGDGAEAQEARVCEIGFIIVTLTSGGPSSALGNSRSTRNCVSCFFIFTLIKTKVASGSICQFHWKPLQPFPFPRAWTRLLSLTKLAQQRHLIRGVFCQFQAPRTKGSSGCRPHPEPQLWEGHRDRVCTRKRDASFPMCLAPPGGELRNPRVEASPFLSWFAFRSSLQSPPPAYSRTTPVWRQKIAFQAREHGSPLAKGRGDASVQNCSLRGST